MPVFRFRLAKLLTLRKRAEDDAARRLAEIQSHRQLCLKHLEEFGRERRDLMLRRAELQKGRVGLNELSRNHYELVLLERAAANTRQRLAAIETELRAARARLAEKSKERKLLEKLGDKQRAEFEERERKRERREQDALPRNARGMAIAMPPGNPDRG